MVKKNSGDISMPVISKRDVYCINLNVLISQELRDKIVVISRQTNRTASELVRKILYKNFLNKNID